MAKNFGGGFGIGKTSGFKGLSGPTGFKPVDQPTFERQWSGLDRYKLGNAITAYLRGQELFEVGGRGGWSTWSYNGRYKLNTTEIPFTLFTFPSQSSTVGCNFTILTKNVGSGLIFQIKSVTRITHNKEEAFAIELENSESVANIPGVIQYIYGWRLGNILDDQKQVKSAYYSYLVFDVNENTNTIYLRLDSDNWHNQNEVITQPDPLEYPLTPAAGEYLSSIVRYACTCQQYQRKEYAAVFSEKASRRIPVTQPHSVFGGQNLKSLVRPIDPLGQELIDGLSRTTQPVFTERGSGVEEKDFKFVFYDDMVPCKHIYCMLLATNNKFPIPNDYRMKEAMQTTRLKIREEGLKLKDWRKVWFFEETRPDFYSGSSPFSVSAQGQTALTQALLDAIGFAVIGVPINIENITIDPDPIPSYKSAYENAPYDPQFSPPWLPDPNTPNTPKPPLIGETSSNPTTQQQPAGIRHSSLWLRTLFSLP